jgi:hypothetical protein
VVSPARRVQSFQMKLGDCVLTADDSCTYFRPRPDLPVTVNGGASVARAGFVTVLRGALPEAVAGAPLLRIIHEDGTAAVKRLEPKLLRLLDCVADSPEILRLFPSVQHEDFYPALRDAIHRSLVARRRSPIAISATPSTRLIVVCLPHERSNQRLCFDLMARIGAYADSGIGLCLLVERREQFAEVKLLCEEFRSTATPAISLFSIDDATDGFSALPFVLSTLGAERFVYMDSGVTLTAAGWRDALKLLSRPGHAIHYFQIVDDTGAPDRINGAISAAAFGWTTAGLLSWISAAPRFARGVFRTNGLPDASSESQILPTAAIRLERMQQSRFADMLDESLLLSRQSTPIHA